ncbi:MAG: SRPBCC family protein [Gemmataceae bacterium]
MADFQSSFEFGVSPSTLFELLTQPELLETISPPEVNLRLVSGPQRMQMGSVLIWKAKRSGIAQQMTVEVVEFENESLITVEQRKGPFRQWIHRQHFAEIEAGTLLKDVIEFEPPGGLLGLTVTTAWVRKDLEKNFAFRNQKLSEVF